VAVIRSSRRGKGALRGGRGLLAAAGLAAALAACSAGQQAQTAFISPNVEGANSGVGPITLRNITLAYPDGGKYAAGADARLEFVMVNSGEANDALVEVRTDAAERVTFGTGQEAGGSATPSGTASGSPSGSPSGTASASPSGTPAPTSTGSATPSPTGTRSGSVAPTPSGSTPAASATASAAPTSEAPSRIEIPTLNYVACQDSGPAVIMVGLTRALLPSEIVQITFMFEKAGEVTIDVPVAVSLTEVSPPPTVDVQGTEEGG
jgi:copper(I)-binding protein